MEQNQCRKNKFTDWSDSDSDYEIDDQDVNKILIVTQTPPFVKKHPCGDRAGNRVCRAKITSELAKVINDGLYYYEQDLWMDQSENDAMMKVILFNFWPENHACPNSFQINFSLLLCSCKMLQQSDSNLQVCWIVFTVESKPKFCQTCKKPDLTKTTEWIFFFW